MREWIPSESSSKGRLVLRAVDAFSAEAFDEVNVVALCAAADVTTGTLYHHFGTKLGLYELSGSRWSDGPSTASQGRWPPARTIRPPSQCGPPYSWGSTTSSTPVAFA